MIKDYAFASNYHAISTNGLYDYLGITDGSSLITNFTTECLPGQCYFSHSNLFSLLSKHHLKWRGFAESMPNACDKTANVSLPNLYWPWHTAIPYFTDLSKACSTHDLPLGNVTLKTGSFFKDLKGNHFANFSMVTPNVCDDMHTCPGNENAIAMGDKWLSEFIPSVINSRLTAHSSAYRASL